MLFLFLFWCLIYIFDNEEGNYRSLIHAILSTCLNLYIIYTYSNDYIYLSMNLTLIYMVCDILFMILDEYHSKKLFIIHHLGVILSILIMYNSNIYLYKLYSELAFLAELTNIFQQIFLLRRDKYTYRIFILIYLYIRIIFIPILLFNLEYQDKDVYIISIIGYIFVINSCVWFYNFITTNNYKTI